MRTNGAKTKKNCWSCAVIVDGVLLSSNEYKTLRDIANYLDLSYNQVVEISNNRKTKSKGKFSPDIKINKVELKEQQSIIPEVLFQSIEQDIPCPDVKNV